jgi:deoxyribose-phosphate aldolase
MRDNCLPLIQIKAAGGIRTLKDLLRVKNLGVTRIGATATKEIISEAVKLGFQ